MWMRKQKLSSGKTYQTFSVHVLFLTEVGMLPGYVRALVSAARREIHLPHDSLTNSCFIALFIAPGG